MGRLPWLCRGQGRFVRILINLSAVHVLSGELCSVPHSVQSFVGNLLGHIFAHVCFAEAEVIGQTCVACLVIKTTEHLL